MLNLLRNTRGRQLLPLIAEQREFYARNRTNLEIRDWQLSQFNRQWPTIRREVPYFATLSGELALPEQFCSWQEFQDMMPVMNRKTIQNNRESLNNRTKGPDFVKTTGGSTAEPIQLPAWHSELRYANADMWYARSWYGVNPSDKLFLIWGHSHLLGRGLSGRVNRIKRVFKDRMLGYVRFSAYNLSEQCLRAAGDAVLSFRPAYIIAYAGALDRFARVNRHHSTAFRDLGLKVAIATAESFPRRESADFIAEVLGCPVVMEYGSVETGPIAHQNNDGLFTVFWRHYFVEGRESKYTPGAYELLLTSLYPRCVPIVRYEIGDLVRLSSDAEAASRQFEAVIGRCNDFITLDNGSIIHSEAFTHAVKESRSITDFQVVQSSDGYIKFFYIGTETVGVAEIRNVRNRLRQIAPQLATVDMQQVGSLGQTVAGKTRRIIRES